MKKQLLSVLIATAFILCGCEKTTKLPKDGLLGELPSVVAEHHEASNALETKFEKASARDDVEGAKQIMAEGLTMEGMYKKNIERMDKELSGKVIPVEFAQNVGLKLANGLAVKSIGGKANVSLEGDVTLTSEASFQANKGGIKLGELRGILVDSEGHAFAPIPCSFHSSQGYKDAYATGDTGVLRGSFRISPFNARQIANLAKIIITQADRNDYKEAVNMEKMLRKEFENQEKN